MVEEIVKSKLVNFLVSDMPMSSINPEMRLGAMLTALFHGSGLWVGGKLELTNSVLRLRANGLNRALQSGINDIEVPLASIRKVSFENGFITNIVGVQTDTGRVLFRCFGAKAVATLIGQMITPQVSSTPSVGRPKRTAFWR